jgi:methionyl-tRNA formyltransferase
MKIVFAGSPRFAIPTLKRLAAEHDVIAVFTQPDRPSGREQQLQASPVKQAALELGLRVEQPEKIKSDAARSLLESLRPEAMVVVGYGQILPPWLLELPRHGCVNLHGSLLPAYRGAAPIQWAVVNGETKTGLTTMLMDPGMDTGPVLLQWETEIGPEETAVGLAERMSEPGAALMLETLKGLERGTVVPKAQDNSQASRAPLLKKEHGRIDWKLPAQEIFNRVRGFLPWPGAFTGFRGQKLQIWWARPVNRSQKPEAGSENQAPGSNEAGALSAPGQVEVEADQMRVACGGGTSLGLLEVQLEGKRRITAADFVRGSRVRTGEILE